MAMSKGCTITLIIVGVVVVVIAGLLWYGWSNREAIVGSLVNKGLDEAATEIKKDVPDGYDEASVDKVFADFKAAITAKTVSLEIAQPMAQYFQNAMSDDVFDKEEGAKFLGMMLEAMGQAPEELPEEAPSDSTIMVMPDSA